MKKVAQLVVPSPTACFHSLLQDVESRIKWAEKQQNEIKEFLVALDQYLQALRKVKTVLDEANKSP